MDFLTGEIWFRQRCRMPVTGIEPMTSSLPWMRSTD